MRLAALALAATAALLTARAVDTTAATPPPVENPWVPDPATATVAATHLDHLR